MIKWGLTQTVWKNYFQSWLLESAEAIEHYNNHGGQTVFWQIQAQITLWPKYSKSSKIAWFDNAVAMFSSKMDFWLQTKLKKIFRWIIYHPRQNFHFYTLRYVCSLFNINKLAFSNFDFLVLTCHFINLKLLLKVAKIYIRIVDLKIQARTFEFSSFE